MSKGFRSRANGSLAARKVLECCGPRVRSRTSSTCLYIVSLSSRFLNDSGPKDHTNIRLPQTMISGIPLLLGIGLRMRYLCVYVVFRASTDAWQDFEPGIFVRHLLRATGVVNCCKNLVTWPFTNKPLRLQEKLSINLLWSLIVYEYDLL